MLIYIQKIYKTYLFNTITVLFAMRVLESSELSIKRQVACNSNGNQGKRTQQYLHFDFLMELQLTKWWRICTILPFYCIIYTYRIRFVISNTITYILTQIKVNIVWPIVMQSKKRHE